MEVMEVWCILFAIQFHVNIEVRIKYLVSDCWLLYFWTRSCTLGIMILWLVNKICLNGRLPLKAYYKLKDTKTKSKTISQHVECNATSGILISVTWNITNRSRLVQEKSLPSVFFLLGDPPASEFCMLTFQNTLSVPSAWVLLAGRILLDYNTYENGTDRVFRNVSM